MYLTQERRHRRHHSHSKRGYMIKINISEYGISADGHAGYAEYGKDIVCSAVTGLLYTMAECIRQEKDVGHLRDMEITLEPGHAVITAVPVSEYVERLSAMFCTVKTGLAIVAEMYPDYVRIENF